MTCKYCKQYYTKKQFKQFRVCKECYNILQRAKRYNTTYNYIKELLKTKYCEICGYRFKNNSEKMIDHNHETGKIRGVLCRKCNTALGQLNDDVELIEKMIGYLSIEPLPIFETKELLQLYKTKPNKVLEDLANRQNLNKNKLRCLYVLQNFKCCICGNNLTDLAVLPDYKGIICNKCNIALKNFKSITNMIKAVKYLW